MSDGFEVIGTNDSAPFSLKLHRGDGMLLLAMNWKSGTPPDDFVGFAIEYQEPGGDRFFRLKNRLCVSRRRRRGDPESALHQALADPEVPLGAFPAQRRAPRRFIYRVTPVFMNSADELSYGEAQEAAHRAPARNIPWRAQCHLHPRLRVVAGLRGPVRSAAIPTLLPAKADEGLTSFPTHPKADEALAWMGFEARSAILEVLDQAIADTDAQVRVVAYDLNEPEVVSRLEKLGNRLKIIIDDSDAHGKPTSAETRPRAGSQPRPGAANVKRQHMRQPPAQQDHRGRRPLVQVVVCGSTNFSWRGFFVQNNNAMILRGAERRSKLFLAAFDDYWSNDADRIRRYGFRELDNARADRNRRPGRVLTARVGERAAGRDRRRHRDEYHLEPFLLAGLPLPDQRVRSWRRSRRYRRTTRSSSTASPTGRSAASISRSPTGTSHRSIHPQLTKNVPSALLKSSRRAARGSACITSSSSSISTSRPPGSIWAPTTSPPPADTKNGENLLLIRDRRIAVSYIVEALRIFDHYHFRVAQQEAKKARKKLSLAKPPRSGREALVGRGLHRMPGRSAIVNFSRRTSPHAPVLVTDAAQKVIPFGCNRMNRLCTGLPSPTGERYPSTSCNQFIDLENSQ